jgi:hypothetical protein
LAPFKEDSTEPEPWRYVKKSHTLEVEKAIVSPLEYVGTVQGRLATWYKESSYFDLRDISSGALVKCFYLSDRYKDVYSLYSDKDVVALVSGRVRANRVERRPEEMRVERVRQYQRLTDEEFERLFGLAPTLRTPDELEEELELRGSDGAA